MPIDELERIGRRADELFGRAPNIWNNAHDQARKHLKVIYRNVTGRRANPEAVPFTLFTVQM